MPAAGGQSPVLDKNQKAAILLMSIGEESAAEVLKHMGPKEVQSIGVAMANIGDVTKDIVQQVMEDFIGTVNKKTSFIVGANDYVRNVLVNALGEEKAAGIIDRILLGGNASGLESLKWMDPRSVVDLIKNEHPQIIAIILSYLESDQAAEVLTAMPDKLRSDLLLRVATLDGVQPAAMKELNNTLEKQLEGSSGVQSSRIGGTKAAANILNFVETSVESGIMEKVREVDGDLGQEIQDL
ncbi:MAG: flagellar motor switch protein FliG, partial [Thiotrichales bacterium]|nr:flagellar motor switch protein FliG [Thiotrichales bacterium]